jgi:flagellar basal-body rod protein FlgG
VGLGVRPVATSRIYSQGNLQQTTNNLDLAIKGNGFFQIQQPDGTTAYTRDGSFQLDANGQMVTNNGYTLLPGITIPPNAQSISIGQDGTVSVLVPGNVAPQTVGQVQLANFINPAGLDPKGQNLFTETASSGSANSGAPNANGLGAVQQGFVETSNVNVVEELVSMIQTQRAYELNSKAVKTSDEMLQKLAQL